MAEEVQITKTTDMFSGVPMYMATVDILGGERRAAGLGVTPERALINLVLWLANNGQRFDLDYEVVDG